MTDQILFDKLAYIDKLKAAGISDDQARAHGDALDAALRDSVATQADVIATRTALTADITRLEHKIEVAVRDLTLRMAAGGVALFGALAAIKFFG